MSFNKVILIGNIGQSAELRYTVQGTPVVNFTVATNERRRNQNGEEETTTTWFRVTLWGKLAENLAKYLQRGKQVFVEGRLRLEEWEDRDGKTRYQLSVTATDIRLLGTRESESVAATEDEEEFHEGEYGSKNLSEEDDIPF